MSKLMTLLASAALAAPTALFAQELGPEVKIEGFGIGLKPPAGWTQAAPEKTPPGVLARFLAPAPNADGRVLDLTINNSREGDTAPQIRDRAAEFYRTTKTIRDVNLAQPRDVATAGQTGFELRMTYKDSKGDASTFVERSWVIGNRVYALRLAAKGDQGDALSKLMDAVGAGVQLDRKVTEAPDPAGFAAIAKRVKESDLRQVIPLEQYLLFEYAEKGQAPRPVGYLFIRFEKAKFLDTEGWYMRVRNVQVLPDGNKIREKAWSFVSPDWSRERWAASATREGPKGETTLLLEENGEREGANGTIKYKSQEQPAEKSEKFTAPANYLPISVEPAFTVLAAREARGDYGIAIHQPGQKLAEWTLTPGKPEELGAERVRVAVITRRIVGQTVGQTQYIDERGRTVSVQIPDSPSFRMVDKATLLRAFPDATNLN